MIDEQGRHAAYIIARGLSEGMTSIEPEASAEAAWVAEIEREAPATAAFNRECTPSYLNFEGDQNRANVRNAPYGGGPMRFFAILDAWREEGAMRGLDIGYEAAIDAGNDR
jgi:cyclohexanone monooxygenase